MHPEMRPEGRGNAFPDASDKKRTHSHCSQVNDCQEPMRTTFYVVTKCDFTNKR